MAVYYDIQCCLLECIYHESLEFHSMGTVSVLEP